MVDSPRKKAVEILMNIEKNGAYVNIEMNKLRAENNFASVDIRFIGQIVNGVIKHKLTIDYFISKYSKVKIGKIAPFVLAVLRSGIYQIIYMDKVPDSAAVNESVKIIKKSSVFRLSGYVNAILRAVKKTELNNFDFTNLTALSVYYSFPLWLVEHWVDVFGYEFTKELLASLNEAPELYVRRTKKIDDVLFRKILFKDGVNAEAVEFPGAPEFDYCYNLGNIGELKTITSYNDALFYIQDPAAAFAAYLLNVKKGNIVIDMCAAPGGKSIFAAELMDNCGKVFSCDIYEHKLELIKSNAQKYGINIIETKLCDATEFNSDFENMADCVLCDVPCSGFGIIRKKPDIKYTRTKADIASLAALSTEILDNAARYLKPGGTLVFSTCTIEPEENEKVVEKFLNKNHDFLPYGFDGETYYKTFYPNIHKTDGFFVCRLKKQKLSASKL